MAIFRRAHYQVIAKVIYEALQRPDNTDNDEYAIVLTARAFSNQLELDNPNFDNDKFLKACGMENWIQLLMENSP